MVTIYTRWSRETSRWEAEEHLEDEETRRKKRWEYHAEEALRARGIECRWVIERWDQLFKDREFHNRIEIVDGGRRGANTGYIGRGGDLKMGY